MLRLWGIRHVRYFYLAWRWHRWWDRVGSLLGAFPNQADIDYLDAIWEGRK